MKYNNRNTHFQINYRNNDKAGAMGVISGADNPNKKKTKEEKVFFDYASKIIKASDRKFCDIGEFIFNKYDALKYTPELNKYNVFKASVIMNHFPDVINRKNSNNNRSQEKKNRYFKEVNYFEQTKEFPLEKLDLRINFYRIRIVTKGNIPEYILVKLEEKTKTIEVENDIQGDLSDDLLLFLGVSEEDIKSENNRFKAYALMMKDLEKI